MLQPRVKFETWILLHLKFVKVTNSSDYGVLKLQITLIFSYQSIES